MYKLESILKGGYDEIHSYWYRLCFHPLPDDRMDSNGLNLLSRYEYVLVCIAIVPMLISQVLIVYLWAN